MIDNSNNNSNMSGADFFKKCSELEGRLMFIEQDGIKESYVIVSIQRNKSPFTAEAFNIICYSVKDKINYTWKVSEQFIVSLINNTVSAENFEIV